jgi:hypothetical protein
MAGAKVNNYSNADSNILEVQTTLDKVFIGGTSVSLTNPSDTTSPVIAAGSKVECGGTLYKFDSNETPTGTPTDASTNYIMLVPNGATCTLAFTATAPTWSDSKQGWYGTSGTANNVYLPIRFYRLGTVYYDKHYLKNKNTGVAVQREYPGISVYTNSQAITSISAGSDFTWFDTKLFDNGPYFLSNRMYLGCGGLVTCSLVNMQSSGVSALPYFDLYSKADAWKFLDVNSTTHAPFAFTFYATSGDYLKSIALGAASGTIAANSFIISIQIL